MNNLIPQQPQFPYVQGAVQTQQQVTIKEVPIWVKIISVLYYMGGVFGIIGGVLLLVGASFIDSLFSQISEFTLGSTMMIIGIITLVFGILDIFIGMGLWKTKNWARVVVIFFGFIGILMGIFITVKSGFLSAVVVFIMNLLIVGYLLFNKKVKEAFADNI